MIRPEVKFPRKHIEIFQKKKEKNEKSLIDRVFGVLKIRTFTSLFYHSKTIIKIYVDRPAPDEGTINILGSNKGVTVQAFGKHFWKILRKYCLSS